MPLSRRRTTATVIGSLAAITILVPALAQSGEEAAVARAVDALARAMIAADGAQLEAVTAPELSYGHSSGRTENRQQFVDSLMSGNMVPRSIDLTERHVIIVGDNAIARHNFTASAVNREGQTVPVRIGQMQVWQKRNGEWVLLAHQAYPHQTPN
jgi:ketosteroid isomerase-like protein